MTRKIFAAGKEDGLSCYSAVSDRDRAYEWHAGSPRTASALNPDWKLEGGLMNANQNLARRTFLKGVAATGAGLASGLRTGPALLAQKSPNDIIGIASIGVGTQGHYLLQLAQAVPNAEIRIICDLYTGNVRAPKHFAKTRRSASCMSGKRQCRTLTLMR